jgi:hypothetical protein
LQFEGLGEVEVFAVNVNVEAIEVVGNTEDVAVKGINKVLLVTCCASREECLGCNSSGVRVLRMKQE